MRNVIIEFSDGQKLKTPMTGTNPEIQRYFAIGTAHQIGKKVNSKGITIPNIQTVESLTIEN